MTSPDEYSTRSRWSHRAWARVIVVDSHNSIDLMKGLDDYDETSIIDAARVALERGNVSPRRCFEAAVARRVPWEWGLDEGMDSMGVSVLAIRVEGGGVNARVVVDGNNRVTRPRERLIGALEGIGFDGAEVMTSDIHTVNGIGATREGYSPVGERMEWGRIVEYVVEAAEEAAFNLPDYLPTEPWFRGSRFWEKGAWIPSNASWSRGSASS